MPSLSTDSPHDACNFKDSQGQIYTHRGYHATSILHRYAECVTNYLLRMFNSSHESKLSFATDI